MTVYILTQCQPADGHGAGNEIDLCSVLLCSDRKTYRMFSTLYPLILAALKLIQTNLIGSVRESLHVTELCNLITK